LALLKARESFYDFFHLYRERDSGKKKEYYDDYLLHAFILTFPLEESNSFCGACSMDGIQSI
jgi:hypothetical protein